MRVRRLPVLLAAAILSAAVPGILPAQSPSSEQWSAFTAWNPGEPRLPEDETMGLLADRRSPDPSWAGALAVCDAVFAALDEERIPVELFAPALRVPLELDFTRVLEGDPPSFAVRYGRPRRDGRRLDVPVRLGTGDELRYGRIYLVLDEEGNWRIEQWAVELITAGGGD